MGDCVRELIGKRIKATTGPDRYVFGILKEVGPTHLLVIDERLHIKVLVPLSAQIEEVAKQ